MMTRSHPLAKLSKAQTPRVNFHGERRSNLTHSTTDPDAMLARKSRGAGAVLASRGHLLAENRNGLVVSTEEVVWGCFKPSNLRRSLYSC